MLVSIFTPTYNRASFLKPLFESLIVQTTFDFEWIIIDDGSTDNTDYVVKSILKQSHNFSITFKKKKNGGKHRAINDGVKIAKGELFFIVDSDDHLTPNAIQKIISWESTLDNSHKWAGIAGLKGFSKELHVGEKNKKEFVDARNTDRKRFHLLGDKAEVYFTEVLRLHPFPEFEGENFITEEVVWNAIARDNYYIRWFSEIIYICDYHADGLTKNFLDLNKRNPQGLRYWAKDKIKTYPFNIIEQMLAIKCYHSALCDQLSNKSIAQNLEIARPFLELTLIAAKIMSIFHSKKT